MKKIIIGLLTTIFIAGLGIGSYFFYQYEGNENYNKEEKYEYCVNLAVAFDENGFYFLKPKFYSSDESVLTVDKDGNIVTLSCGTAKLTAKGFNFEYTTEITVSDHTGFIANCDEPYTCDRCGFQVMVPGGHNLSRLTCVKDSVCYTCGYVAAVHSGHDYMDPDCENPYTCKVCGATRGKSLGHKWVKPTCLEPAYCSVCNKVSGEALGHNFKPATCLEDSSCIRCGIEGEEKATGHNMLPADCENPVHCANCDYTEGKELGHKYSTNVCLKPVYCTRCEKQISDALPHDFAAATCTKPKTCKRCKQTEGQALGHTLVEATCQRGSYCSKCGTTVSAALSHTYVTGEDGREICAYCGKSKASYQSSYSGGSGGYYSQSADISGYANDVLRIVNEEREAAGLGALSMDATLCQAADIRAVEINSSFSHTRPNGTRCFTAMDEVGYSYGTAGENIAYGYSSPSSVMDGWMNSPGHRANILNGSFNRLGVGVYSANGRLYWVQMFSD